MDKKRAALVAIIGGLFIFLVKMGAWFMSGSVALLSDALESIVNIAASLLMFYSVYVSGIPADEEHHYGHEKIENISSLIEGLLILTAALFIIHTALERIYHPVELTRIEGALGVSLFATAMNGGLSWFLGRTAGESGSMALEGDAKHLLSDVITSVGVAAGLWVAQISGWARCWSATVSSMSTTTTSRPAGAGARSSLSSTSRSTGPSRSRRPTNSRTTSRRISGTSSRR